MKILKRITTTVLLLLAISVSAQQGINYKAIIKDGSGNVVASQLIVVQFTVLEGAAQTNVYQEQHTPTTDANGIIMVNIGEGTPVSGVFSTIDWAADTHFLNVQINTGAGLVDMGTTEFKAVPYAKHADTAAIATTATTATNVSGLEKITEGGNTGWRLIGQNPVFYGNIGKDATDLSISNIEPDAPFGATGNLSTAMGGSTTASGDISTAMGSGTTASGVDATAMGISTTASGNGSTAMGLGTKAEAFTSTAIGQYNIGGGHPTASTSVSTDPLFEIGNGTSTSNSNALTVFGGTNALLTNGNSGFMMIGNSTGQNLVFDTNNIMARSNGGKTSLSLQGDGGDLIINSSNYFKDNGNVGIGTTIPGSKLDVYGVIRARNNVWPTSSYGVELAYNSSLGIGYIQSVDRNSNPDTFKDLAVGALNLRPVSNNFTNLGTSSYRFIKVYTVNGVSQSSDRRLKKEIKNLNYGLNTVMKLRPVSYKWKQGSQDVNLGLIAQEVQKLIPEVIDVGTDNAKTLGMKYTELIPVLIKAIQEQQDIITNSELRIQNYESEVSSLNKRMEKLEALLIDKNEVLKVAGNKE